jgi:predicted esterase
MRSFLFDVRAVRAGLALALALVGCGPVDGIPSDAGFDGASQRDADMVDPGPPRAIFVLPRDPGTPFFDLPWPSDLRRTPSGHIDVRGFPNRRRIQLIDRYLTAITARQRGFATNGAVYFRFSRPVDPRSLPRSVEDTLAPDATVFLLDVDATSSTRLQRHPAVVVYQEEPTLYWPPRTVAIRPVHGIPLAGGRRYAAVVTRGVRTAEGGPFGRDEDFEALMSGGGDREVEAARAVYGPAIEAIVEAGVPRDDILSVAVFTTQDPVAELALYRDWMHASYPPPRPRPEAWRLVAERPNFHELQGRYGPVPIFQEGTIPYLEEGGAMEPGPDGRPVVHGEYDARFALTVPRSPMPESGYPLVLYAHGTGGDYRSFIVDGTASLLASIGVACMGIDQIHHGERNPTTSSENILFFNVNNPDAARDNNRQSALDVVQQARVVPSLTVPRELLQREEREIHFDRGRVWFFGHSQGGLVAPLFLGIDDGVSAAVISAGGALIAYALLYKTEPVSIPSLVRVALGLAGSNEREAFERENFGFEHPIVTLLQGWIEASDGSNFAHLVFAAPRPGFAPKSVLATEGLRDVFSPPGSIEALAASMRLPIVEPVAHRIEALDLLAIPSVRAPVSGNVAGGAATAGLLQYSDEGHFLVFSNADAQARIRGFFGSLIAGTPTIPAPP